jgi:hypothetical protein
MQIFYYPNFNSLFSSSCICCLASVKCAKQFASTFADISVIISQDDKAKIGLEVPAIGHSFCTLQSINELTTVADHDFPGGFR